MTKADRATRLKREGKTVIFQLQGGYIEGTIQDIADDNEIVIAYTDLNMCGRRITSGLAYVQVDDVVAMHVET